MANKTQLTDGSVDSFLAHVEPESRHTDAVALCEMMERVSGEAAMMWGPAIVGFGSRHYRYESGREGDICRIGFSPRKAQFALYGCALDSQAELVNRLGTHTRGSGCLYIKKLADVDVGILEQLLRGGFGRPD